MQHDAHASGRIQGKMYSINDSYSLQAASQDAAHRLMNYWLLHYFTTIFLEVPSEYLTMLMPF